MPVNKKLVKPGLHIPIDYFTVDCGRCGSRLYEIKILPQENRGKIMAIVCAKCRNTLKVDPKGWIEGAGTTSFAEISPVERKRQ